MVPMHADLMDRIKMKVLFTTLLLFLVGCANLPNSSYNQMSPDQLKAINADKNITIVCSSVNTLTTDVINVYAIIDKAVIPNGSLTVTNACGIEIMTVPK
jgi:starvation-inducible outer membrane lipoprotein